MNKKLILTGMILLALVITGGTFAYTYSGTAMATLDVIAATGQISTQEPAPLPEQPDWYEVLPELETDQMYLFPESAGDDTELPTQYPDTGSHWDKVDDEAPDEGDTYVSTESSKHWERDLYRLTNGLYGDGPIGAVTVFYRFAAGGDYEVQAMAEIKTDGIVFSGPTETQTGTEFTTRSYNMTVNPKTNESWTWDEVNALQAGVTMKGDSKNKPAICTQVFVLVDYELPPIIEGDVPAGDLFTVTPHPDYTGDLLVNIYLTNTGFLKMAYQHLNMKVYVEGSLEADKTSEYQVLSLENGVALFNIDGATAESYNIEITGGGYGLVSGDPYEWGEGWTITPEFYCEVSQR